MKRLPIGTKVYMIIESLSDRSFWDEPYHYEIISGEIKEYNRAGRYDEYVVLTRNRLGLSSCMEYPDCKDLGKSFFLTYEEAVDAADRATDQYERTWHRMLKEPTQLQRPWKEAKA